MYVLIKKNRRLSLNYPYYTVLSWALSGSPVIYMAFLSFYQYKLTVSHIFAYILKLQLKKSEMIRIILGNISVLTFCSSRA